ncbi:MAG: nuclear transport factor 2 family protein [Pseudomonadota bacterium]
MSPSPIASRILEVLHSKDQAGLAAMLAEDVTFRPPTYWAEWQGREVVALLLEHVGGIFEGLTYRRTWMDGPNHALEFQAKVGELDIVGVDLLTCNEAGLITDFEVVARPYKTVGLLRERMMASVMQDPRMLPFVQQLAASKAS